MNILISGGAGFIGRWLCNELCLQHQVFILDNFNPQIHGENKYAYPLAYSIDGDVTILSDWKRALANDIDIVIHLAAETGTGQSMDEVSRYVSTNTLGTAVMIEALKGSSVKKVILASSRAVYGEFCKEGIISPVSIYGATKQMQEMILSISNTIPFTILRYQNVYGEFQSLINPYTGIISIFSTKLLSDGQIMIYDLGEPTRDFIYVSDVVSATLMCLDEKTNGQTLDVGTGISTSILDVANMLREKLNSKSKIEVSSYHRKGDILHAVGNIEKISQLGWKPLVSLDNGLDKFVKWVKK